MKIFLTASLLALSVIGPAHAGWFSSDPSCKASDMACLSDLALTGILTEIQEQEPSNHSGAGRLFAQLEPLLDDAQSAAAFDKLDAAKPSERFWDEYEYVFGRAASRRAMNFEGILSAVEGRGYPRQVKWNDYISGAIYETANGPDADKLADLFLREQAFFAEYAQRASVPIISYMARHDLDQLKAFAADPDTSKKTLLRSLTPMALQAELACLDGEKDLGRQIMAFRDSYAETQQYSPEMSFLPLVRRFPFILACDGEEAAVAELAKIEAGLDSIPTGKTITYRGLEMSVDGMRNRDVVDYVALPLSYHYHDTDRTAQARALFDKFKAPSVQYTVTLEGDPVYVSDGLSHPLFASLSKADKADLTARMAELMDYEWERALELRDEQDRYATSLATRLDYFTNRFDPPFEICCSNGQGVGDMLDVIVEASASGPVPARALQRTLELFDRIEVKGKYMGFAVDAKAVIRLAMAERPVGCVLSEDRLNDLLVEIEEQDSAAARTLGVMAMIAYQQAPLGERNDTDCVIE